MDTLPTELRSALRWLSLGDPQRCIHELTQLVSREADDPALHNALASVLAGQGAYDRAREHFERTLALAPNHLEALTNLGTLSLELGALHRAHELLTRAIALPNAPAQAWVGLGRVYCLLGRHADAHEALARATDAPRSSPTTWSQRCYATLLDPALKPADVVASHRTSAAQIAPAMVPARFENACFPGRKLRLGYVSADLREHSVACFIEGVLAHHDRDQVELYLYSDVRREDAVSGRLYASADVVRRSASWTHAQLSEHCRADHIDVLIDLSGHMQPNRLPMFGLAPAPVSFTYLGYPGTTGSTAFAARLSDAWADPIPASGTAGSEPLVHLAGGYFAFTPPPDAPDVGPVPKQGPVFCSFNDALKLNDHVINAWAGLLTRCSDARLCLKARQLGSRDLAQVILARFATRGIDAARIELLPSTPTRREHLACYAHAHVALDTFPYAGATTSCEALYMGVPVITLAGETHASRLGVSILNGLGQSRWITHSVEGYIERALDVARDRVQLEQWRHEARDTLCRAPLGDSRRVARAIEQHASEHFQRWLADRSLSSTVRR
ncbi:MAG: tetratricopeptide repeat protein [Polyangiales bacterium]